MKIIFFLVLFFKTVTFSQNNWLGEWIALDEWQSEFSIKMGNIFDRIYTQHIIQIFWQETSTVIIFVYVFKSVLFTKP